MYWACFAVPLFLNTGHCQVTSKGRLLLRSTTQLDALRVCCWCGAVLLHGCGAPGCASSSTIVCDPTFCSKLRQRINQQLFSLPYLSRHLAGCGGCVILESWCPSELFVWGCVLYLTAWCWQSCPCSRHRQAAVRGGEVPVCGGSCDGCQRPEGGAQRR